MSCLLQHGALFYKKSGLGALPLALFNGVPLSPDEMDPDELETIILQRIMDTTTAFQRAVFMVRHVCTHTSYSTCQTYLFFGPGVEHLDYYTYTHI